MEIVLGLALVAFIAFLLPGIVEMETGTPITGSSKLSTAQIRQIATVAGFMGGDLETAVAIAKAESGGNPNAVGDLTLGVSVGLWQINLHFHPEYDHASLLDPQYNANAAWAIYDAAGSNFSPWSTYKNGTYEAHLNSDGVAV